MGSFNFFLREILRDRERARRSEVFPEWAVVHSEVSCSDWLLVSLAALWDLNILRQKSFRPRLPPCICSSLQRSRASGEMTSQSSGPSRLQLWFLGKLCKMLFDGPDRKEKSGRKHGSREASVDSELFLQTAPSQQPSEGGHFFNFNKKTKYYCRCPPTVWVITAEALEMSVNI